MAERIDVVAVYGNKSRTAPIEYVLNVFMKQFGVDHRIAAIDQLGEIEYAPDTTLIVSYGKERPEVSAFAQVHIYASDFFDDKYLKNESMPTLPLHTHEAIPIIYEGHGPIEDWVRFADGLIESKIDLVASAFFMLTRYEETIVDATDQYWRFPASASVAHKAGFLRRPIVNEYADLLWGWIKMLHPMIKGRPHWPGGKEFAACLTHDVDATRACHFPWSLVRIAEKAIRERKLVEACGIAGDHVKVAAGIKRDPFDTFGYFLDTEQRFGFSSSYYFMAGRDSRRDTRDTIQRQSVRDLVRFLEKEGCEIGLHSSFNSYVDPQLMAAEKSRLDGVVTCKTYGCRQHYLRWKTPDTWRIQEKIGLLYDSSLTYADAAGFRCGYCMPFQPFDVLENRRLALWELPLTVMDGSLQGREYEGLTPREATSDIIDYIETVRRANGAFVLLWHNSSFGRIHADWSNWERVYEDVMAYLGSQNAHAVNGRSLVEWWASR